MNASNRNFISSNNKYLTRSMYYGRLKDIEYVNDAVILIFIVYTATEFFANSCTIRVYVPTSIQDRIVDEVVAGDTYLVVTAPYRINFNKAYRHRVDMLVNIFKEII